MILTLTTLNTCKSNSPLETAHFVDQLERQNPNVIVCLQEIDRGAKRSGGVDVAEVIARGRDYFFARTISFCGASASPEPVSLGQDTTWDYGLATVSTLPITEQTVILLGPSEDDFWKAKEKTGDYVWEQEPRVALLLKIDCDGKDLWVCNTHLAHSSDRSASSPVRQAQVQKLNDALTKFVPQGSALIVAGDFNATINNPDLMPLLKNFSVLSCDAPTYENPSKGVSVEIDHILHQNLTSAYAVTAERTAFSDHKAVTMICVP